jgi:hypothetical protein
MEPTLVMVGVVAAVIIAAVVVCFVGTKLVEILGWGTHPPRFEHEEEARGLHSDSDVPRSSIEVAAALSAELQVRVDPGFYFFPHTPVVRTMD